MPPASESPVLYTVEIIGNPKGWMRAGACVRGGHARIFEKTTGPAAEWKQLLLLGFTQTRPAAPLADPMGLSMVFRFERPQAHFNKKGLTAKAPLYMIGKPDLDNAVKLVMDSLVVARVIADDRSVVQVSAGKLWCKPGENPGMVLMVYREGKTAGVPDGQG
jgi:Holliday junction resolvase RusA-like endonuclease